MNYSRADIDRMRRDAIRRTKEMHSHANYVNNNMNKKADINNVNIDNVQADDSESKAPKKNNPENYCQNNNNNNGTPFNKLLSGLFSNGNADNDTLIIVLLIILLSGNGGNMKLILALGYILM